MFNFAAILLSHYPPALPLISFLIFSSSVYFVSHLFCQILFINLLIGKNFVLCCHSNPLPKRQQGEERPSFFLASCLCLFFLSAGSSSSRRLSFFLIPVFGGSLKLQLRIFRPPPFFLLPNARLCFSPSLAAAAHLIPPSVMPLAAGHSPPLQLLLIDGGGGGEKAAVPLGAASTAASREQLGAASTAASRVQLGAASTAASRVQLGAASTAASRVQLGAASKEAPFPRRSLWRHLF
jgi:hypothetical protein